MAPSHKHLLASPNKRSCGWEGCARVEETEYAARVGMAGSRTSWLRLRLFRRVSVLARVSTSAMQGLGAASGAAPAGGGLAAPALVGPLTGRAEWPGPAASRPDALHGSYRHPPCLTELLPGPAQALLAPIRQRTVIPPPAAAAAGQPSALPRLHPWQCLHQHLAARCTSKNLLSPL